VILTQTSSWCSGLPTPTRLNMPSNKADAQKVNPASSSPELIAITYKELKQAHYRIAADTTEGRERAGAAGAAAIFLPQS
jgi:hypothetical protein